MLSDFDIFLRGGELVESFNHEMVQPASIDLRLAEKILIPTATNYVKECSPIDPLQLDVDYTTEYLDKPWAIPPGGFILGSTVEKVTMPQDIVGCVEGKSSLARLGLFIHITAGFIDPGFHGNITLEIYNVNPRPIILRKDMKICQIAFTALDNQCLYPYGHERLNSKYQGQTGVTGSRYEL
jgi:dCTP deaminase